ncbi:hypothetical protein BDM02DRAFT_3115473 [Thelephora ganbajun]|uniref:Uncharacterized protein n=1 Tax=Thelephora ganbajun TaxID=370292 RepID=A0ACB6ZFS5_THEGA|nr:hypothetical protein BDM02DRAFT_3115473 [Thelephora ganbajun]
MRPLLGWFSKSPVNGEGEDHPQPLANVKRLRVFNGLFLLSVPPRLRVSRTMLGLYSSLPRSTF